jgi:hypothetical protein
MNITVSDIKHSLSLQTITGLTFIPMVCLPVACFNLKGYVKQLLNRAHLTKIVWLVQHPYSNVGECKTTGCNKILKS